MSRRYLCLFPVLAAATISLHAETTQPPAADINSTRAVLGKWIETQQILSKERKDWQQGKEILLSRIELLKKETTTLEEKIKQAQSGVVEATKRRDEFQAENEQLKAAATQLNDAATRIEADLKRMFKTLPEPIQARLQPLAQRMPEDPAKTRVSAAERFQNALGILNELNKANNDLTVNHEVHTLADGKPSEVKAIYVGLAQAYYLSANGQAGIGRPSPDGWNWKSANDIARDVTLALDILQGKHSATFVPLPVQIQ